MRITNRIMHNNSLFNINNNKLREDNLSTQLATGKSITRPSDDPVVAIRALRLRTNVSTVTQFYKKNAPDADLWLTTTEDALGTLNDVLTDMVKQANSAANEYKGVEDLKTIMEQLSELAEEVYATGDTDYAGRYIFTGYRTDTPLTFQEDMEVGTGSPTYTITEQFNRDNIDQMTYVDTKNLFNMNETTYKEKLPSTGNQVNENDITSTSVYRLRLAYDNLDEKDLIKSKSNPPALNPPDLVQGPIIEDPNDKDYGKIDTSNPAACNIFPSTSHKSAEEAMAAVQVANSANPKGDYVAFCAATGEIFLSDSVYEKLNASTDEIRVEYKKSTFLGSDFRPEHYYACKADLRDNNGNPTGEIINYNQDYLPKGRENARQEITYDVGANQRIRINTTADEVFNPGIRKDIQDLKNRLKDLEEIETTVSKLKEALENATNDTAKAEVQQSLDAAEKARTYLQDDMNKMFGIAITKFQGYLDDTSVAITANGSRGKRLELISNRLGSQKLTYEDLQSQNEDIDIAEAMVKIQSAELTYNASLMATGKILQTSLLNYL